MGNPTAVPMDIPHSRLSRSYWLLSWQMPNHHNSLRSSERKSKKF